MLKMRSVLFFSICVLAFIRFSQCREIETEVRNGKAHWFSAILRSIQSVSSVVSKHYGGNEAAINKSSTKREETTTTNIPIDYATTSKQVKGTDDQVTTTTTRTITQDRTVVETTSSSTTEEVTTHKLHYLAEQLHSSVTETEQSSAVADIRRYLADFSEDRLESLVTRELVDDLVLALDSNSTSTQTDALWSLTNIASSSLTAKYTQMIIDTGALPILIELLYHNNTDVAYQATWALGNMMGENDHEYRDLVVEAGVVDGLIHFCQNNVLTSTEQSNTAWVISNVFRRKPLPGSDIAQKLFPYLKNYLETSQQETSYNAIWGLVYMTNCDTVGVSACDQIELVVQNETLSLIVEMIDMDRTRWGAIRLLGNIAAGTTAHTKAVVDSGALQSNGMMHSLELGSESERKNTFWMLSNVLTDNTDNVQAVIDAKLMPLIVAVLADKHAEADMRREASWALANYCIVGNNDQVAELFDMDIIGALCASIDGSDEEIHIFGACTSGSSHEVLLNNMLDCMEAIFKVMVKHFDTNGEEAFLEKLSRTCQMQDKLSPLSADENEQIASKAGEMRNYFDFN